ncbi:pectinesterase [Flavobacterium sp. CF108]|uniref:pectate lyase n=1 Tax=unclassified Flavobacterium TaxID=196869 RepID=UPI0008B0A23B|nr:MULTISPECIES: pectate lyase [unclassified Flavobacterium]SEO62139.1 pectinesterase [Flavobacterium sp. fv08]SHH95810.1 pectinesterase [Flavobacterium sp. CF108]
MIQLKKIILLFIVGFSFAVKAQNTNKNWPDIIRKNDASWFGTEEAKKIAENVLLYQRGIGGWPKNIQMQNELTSSQKKELLEIKKTTKETTTDNGATTQEMLFMSKMYAQVKDERYKESFLKGLNYLLEAQYANGGWPQFYPLKKGYYTHITYNDDSMVRILNVMKEVAEETDFYSIKPSKEIAAKTKTAFNKGIDCIIKTQYKQNGVLTAWCAQHDEVTLLPAKARAYELPSLSGKESAKIVLLLMSIQKPSSEIITAVKSANIWFEKTKITNLEEKRVLNDAGKIIDKKMISVQNASPIWARFMELDNNEPFFSDRDGIKKKALDEIGAERRNGYAWYTDEPKEVLKKYDSWAVKNGIKVSETASEKKKANFLTVAQDGSGDFTKIQDAICASPSFPYEKVTIFIKNGTYKEKLRIPEWNNNLILLGESKENTIITFDDNFSKINLGRNSTFYTSTLLVEGDDFSASNLTIQNASGDKGQAIALSVVSNRAKISNCIILGNQDTLYLSGKNAKQYFKDCYIEGTTDFIFGGATALFENCVIHSIKSSYVTAASTPQGTAYGFVFKNCKLTAEPSANAVYLGRPWRIYAKTVYINCELGKHIKPEGWENWSKPDAEKNAFYAEYNNNGEGFQPAKRVTWSHQLTKSEADQYSIENILKDTVPNWYF